MTTTNLNLNVGETKILSIEWLNSIGVVTPTPGRDLSWRIAQIGSVITIGQPDTVPVGGWFTANTCNLAALEEGQATIIAAANFNPPERPSPKTEFASLVVTVVNLPVGGRITVSNVTV